MHKLGLIKSSFCQGPEFRHMLNFFFMGYPNKIFSKKMLKAKSIPNLPDFKVGLFKVYTFNMFYCFFIR